MRILTRVVGMPSSDSGDAIIEQMSALLAQAEQRADKRHREVCDRIARTRDELQKQLDARFDRFGAEMDDLSRRLPQVPISDSLILLDRVAQIERVARTNWRFAIASVGLAIISLVILALHAWQLGALSRLAGH